MNKTKKEYMDIGWKAGAEERKEEILEILNKCLWYNINTNGKVRNLIEIEELMQKIQALNQEETK